MRDRFTPIMLFRWYNNLRDVLKVINPARYIYKQREKLKNNICHVSVTLFVYVPFLYVCLVVRLFVTLFFHLSQFPISFIQLFILTVLCYQFSKSRSFPAYNTNIVMVIFTNRPPLCSPWMAFFVIFTCVNQQSPANVRISQNEECDISVMCISARRHCLVSHQDDEQHLIIIVILFTFTGS